LKRWKKIVLALLLLILVSQAPFVFRRYQLARLRTAVASVNASRVAPIGSDFVDYKGVIHVHSNLGGHSTGTLPEVVRAAKLNGLKFVLMTEHSSAEINTAEQTLSGEHGGVLFIPGNEFSTTQGDRFLVSRRDHGDADGLPSETLLASVKSSGDLSFVAYPGQFHSWNLTGFDGVEVYNLYTNAKQINPLVMFFDGLWCYRSYSDLLFARFYERPSAELARYDDLIRNQNRRIVAIAGNDAHQNVGFGLSDSSGKKLLYAQLDPYDRNFQIVRNHLLLKNSEQFNQASVLEALRSGHSYIAFDLFGDPTGFLFSAKSTGEERIMGDEVNWSDGLRLYVNIPVKSHIELIRDGETIASLNESSSMDFPVKQKGVYRVEVFLPQLGSIVADKPWIISNPIYVN
jgi:hypothetical protein